MALLLKWNLSGSAAWSVYDGAVWDSEGGAWMGEDYLFYISDEGTAIEKYWQPAILSFSPAQRNMKLRHGGFCQWDFGSVTMAPDFFYANAMWPPPKNSVIEIYYTASTFENATILFAGTAHRATFNRNQAVYDLYGHSYTHEFLIEWEDYNEDTVPMPRMLGAWEHGSAKRLPDRNTAPTYWKAHVSGTCGVNWHCYDDGVNIDANVIENSDGLTFSLKFVPVGEVTISGTGDIATLDDLFVWACNQDDRLPVEYDGSLGASPSPSIQCYVESQVKTIDLMDDIAAWNRHMFYEEGTIINLLDMTASNGSGTLDEYEFMDSSYDLDVPIKAIKAKWKTREATEDTRGKYVKDVDHESSVPSAYAYGDELTVEVYNSDKATIDAKLQIIMDALHDEWPEISMPVGSSIPPPGKQLTVTDNSGPGSVTATIKVREYRIDLNMDRLECVVRGEGTIS